MLKPSWRNAIHADSWMQTLERHPSPALGGLIVGRIERTKALTVLTPVLGNLPGAVRLVRQRIRLALRAWIRSQKKAGEAIDGALSAVPAVKVHLRAPP